VEFLVTMIHPAAQVTQNEGAAREAARGLGVSGTLRRLWRIPSKPEEVACIGLFAARDADELRRLLASSPQLVGPDADVAALGEHLDDPARTGTAGRRPGMGPEYLITTTVTMSADTDAEADEIRVAIERQSRRDHDLAMRGHLVRLWSLPAEPDGPRTIGLWRARDPGDLMTILESLPLSAWMTIETTPLTPHPHDPVRFV
jgi:muconolactone delta-isomerase